MAAGNHDAANRMTKALKLPDGVTLLPSDEPATVRLPGDVAVHGQSFPRRDESRNLARAYPPAEPGCLNIGLLHTAATGREGHENYAPCTLEDLHAKGYDYWALGHVHAAEILSQDPPVVFPGNIQGRNIRETGPKGCMLVAVDERGYVTPEFRPLDVLRWERLQVEADGAGQATQVVDLASQGLADLAEACEQPLAVRVEVGGRCPAHAELLADPARWIGEIRAAGLSIAPDRLWIEKVKLGTAPPLDEPRGDDPVSVLLAMVDAFKDDPERLKALGESLQPLWHRLPAELKSSAHGEEPPIAPDDPQWVRAMLDRVRPLLRRRLLEAGQ
jgi:hypothetical protein